MAHRNSVSLLLGALMALLLNGCFLIQSAPQTPDDEELLAIRDQLGLFAQNNESIYRLDVVSRGGHGTGFVVTSDGLIVTCEHVSDAGPISVMLYENGQTGGKPLVYPGKLIAVDKRHDLALLKIDRTFRYPMTIANDADVKVGDEVYDVGYPFNFGLMTARGHVMRKDYTDNRLMVADDGTRVYVENMTLTDFLAGPGTSGSPIMLARNGHVAGVMRLLIPKGFNVVTLMTVRAFTPVKHLRSFLRQHRVPFLNPDGEKEQYANEPKPAPIKASSQTSTAPVPAPDDVAADEQPVHVRELPNGVLIIEDPQLAPYLPSPAAQPAPPAPAAN